MKHFRFRLYIVSSAANSIVALDNFTTFCRKHLANDYEIELVDVVKDPVRALSDKVFVTPTLIKTAPTPVLQISGTLADQQELLSLLNIKPHDEQ